MYDEERPYRISNIVPKCISAIYVHLCVSDLEKVCVILPIREVRMQEVSLPKATVNN